MWGWWVALQVTGGGALLCPFQGIILCPKAIPPALAVEHDVSHTQTAVEPVPQTDNGPTALSTLHEY
jgi:hypothetical protein